MPPSSFGRLSFANSFGAAVMLNLKTGVFAYFLQSSADPHLWSQPQSFPISSMLNESIMADKQCERFELHILHSKLQYPSCGLTKPPWTSADYRAGRIFVRGLRPDADVMVGRFKGAFACFCRLGH